LDFLNTNYKIYTKITYKWLTNISDMLLLEVQNGFSYGYLCNTRSNGEM
jgi:hypothetical protein